MAGRYGRLSTPWLAYRGWVASTNNYSFYIHQSFPGDNIGGAKMKVMQACLNEIHHLAVRRIRALAVLKYHHGDTDAVAPSRTQRI